MNTISILFIFIYLGLLIGTIINNYFTIKLKKNVLYVNIHKINLKLLYFFYVLLTCYFNIGFMDIFYLSDIISNKDDNNIQDTLNSNKTRNIK